MRYGNWIIDHDPPPIPFRGADYAFRHQDYDGPEDRRAGRAASEADAKAQIDEMESDL